MVETVLSVRGAVKHSRAMIEHRTQVAIVGAGPAGLLLAHLLARAGIDSVILEVRSRDYVEHRIRAGVLEQPTVELLCAVGLGDRLRREGLEHKGITLRFDGADHRIDFGALTGRTITVYGQQEVVKDLIAARLAAGGEIRFEANDVAVFDVTGDEPSVTFTDAAGRAQRLRADVVAGCDGFHGVCRQAIPTADQRIFERDHPFAWLGILAEAPPSHDELIYAHSDRGFALHSMRSPALTRLYLQVDPAEDLAAWPDRRIWDELAARFARRDGGFTLTEGRIRERGITGMRSFVAETMRHGRLFLAGDAAHIVPPTGAKGMNLAIADVAVLAEALERFFATGATDLLDAYPSRCLRRVWRAVHFSGWMTAMLHTSPDSDPFDRRLQLAQLHYTVSSQAAATSLAENYVGLPHGF
jgi:p-hydroxybenzoate 3-monooxygenase